MNLINSELAICIVGTLVAILLRCIISLHPYSGEGKSPMYGDYEAQRHWMEITYNLPIKDWYHNTTNNDLEYWGLDYPPLTAYHSYLCGMIAYYLNPNYVELHKSRGYESEDHKFYMRYTVIIADILLYIPSIYLYFIFTRRVYGNDDSNTIDDDGIWDYAGGNLKSKGRVKLESNKKKKNKANKQLQDRSTFDNNTRQWIAASIIIALLYPGLILIDHGHFQYNCISLAFCVLAATFVCIQKSVLGSIFFCLALNYKQMELYHAFPFFLYLLSTCIPKPGQNAISGLVKLLKLATTVIITFGVIWLPFLYDINDMLQVIRRLFPVSRGLFEDKVSNLWCTLNVVYKFKNNFSTDELFRYCTVTTLAAVIPSGADLFLRPNRKKFVLALINSSLSFFLFSYQVHEKSILIAALPVLLYLPNNPLISFWFLIMSTFSMLPLLMKDGLVIAYIGSTIFYTISFYIYVKNDHNDKNMISPYYTQLIKLIKDINDSRPNMNDVTTLIVTHLWDNYVILKIIVLRLIFTVSMIGCITLTFLSITFIPPEKYPDLFAVLISTYSFVHFFVFFIYFNVEQIRLPQSFDYVKLKMS